MHSHQHSSAQKLIMSLFTLTNRTMTKAFENELTIADETIGTLLDEIDELRGYLAFYGGHVHPCKNDGGRCFCGWLNLVNDLDLTDI